MRTKLNVFFSKIITNTKLPFLLFLRFLSLCLQPERFQLHTKSKGSWVVSHTASSTKVRINGYFTTHLSPSSFLRVLSSSHFVADMMLYNQNFVAVCACELAMSHRMNKDCILIIPPPFRDASSPAQGQNTPHEEQLISFTDSLNAKEEELCSQTWLVTLNPEIFCQNHFIANWFEPQVCGCQHLTFCSM